MATGVSSWSTTAATNATADASVNWAEGQAPSSLNDSARGMMASMAKWRDDYNGVTTGGTSTAYTLTTNQGFASLGALANQRITIIPNNDSGASPTLAVDSLTAKPIQKANGSAVGAGDLQANTPYSVRLNNGQTAFLLCDDMSIIIEPGTAMLFVQTAAPTGWTKVNTNDNSALRLTTGTAGTGGSTGFTSIFAARTITQANLPSGALSGSSATFTGDPGDHVGTSGSALNQTFGSGQQLPIGDGGVPSGTVSALNLGGSGTAMDFAVQYVDVIQATKN